MMMKNQSSKSCQLCSRQTDNRFFYQYSFPYIQQISWKMIAPSNPRLSLIVNPVNLPATDPSRFIYSNKKLQNLNCIFKQSDNLGGLFLGDVVSTLKQDLLKSHNIKAILSCMCEKVNINPIVNCHKIIPVKDLLDFPIIQHFDEAVAWIDQKRKEKHNVLVHCHAGVSRSATIVIAYLIRTYNWNPFQALEFVRQQRQRAKPNAGFWNQINQYYNYWSKQGRTLPNQPQIVSKENVTVKVQQMPMKMASQQNLTRTTQMVQQEKERKNHVLELTSKPILTENNEKLSVTRRRRRIFDKLDLEKSVIGKSKKEEIDAEYQLGPKTTTRESLAPTRKPTHAQQTSILLEQSSIFSENRSTYVPNQPQPQNAFKPRTEQVYMSPLIYSTVNFRPQVKYSLEPMQNSGLRSFVRSP